LGEIVGTLGQLSLTDLRMNGQLQILARDDIQSGHIVIDGLTIRAADTRSRAETVAGNGVHGLQAALTLWNQQPDGGVFAHR
jgi:hypothetical protein